MSPVVAVIAPGAMGAAVGKRLVENGVTVLTSLDGRSDETRARAKAAGMVAAKNDEIARADFILSILPPGDALSLAAVIAPTECPFVDAGIIGQPPKPGDAGPRIYASGAAAPRVASLRDYGLDIRVLDGATSAASALKMSYAGITKGTQAIGAAMMLAATRAGSADALMAELQLSQKEMLAWLKRQLTMMPPKAYRWVAEMQEIAGFVGDDPAARDLYEGAAEFYERFAEDFADGGKEAKALAGFLGKAKGS